MYEHDPRFAGGAYSPVLKKVDRFAAKPLPTTLRDRDAWAARLMEIDGDVKRIVAKLQAQGLRSPYVRDYVVARINPVRFVKMKKGATAPMTVPQALLRMSAAAKKFDTKKVSSADLAWVAAAGPNRRSDRRLYAAEMPSVNSDCAHAVRRQVSLHRGWPRTRKTTPEVLLRLIAMPEISRFLGVVIYMYYNDHAPPHVHARY